MAKKKPAAQNDAAEMLKWLAETTDGIELKGAKTPYTSINGNMYCFVTTERALAMRLGSEEHAKFLSQHPGSQCMQHGRVMKEYVVVPDEILGNKRKLRNLFKKTCEYASALKPKATTRKKTKKK